MPRPQWRLCAELAIDFIEPDPIGMVFAKPERISLGQVAADHPLGFVFVFGDDRRDSRSRAVTPVTHRSGEPSKSGRSVSSLTRSQAEVIASCITRSAR